MRWIAGLLLVIAAALKFAELVVDPTAVLTNPLGHFFLPAQIVVELVLGTLVLSGMYWRNLRWILILLFTAFASYSLYLALRGAASCGCFGPVRINPWWTFGLDLAVAIGLLVSTWVSRTPGTASICSPNAPQGLTSPTRIRTTVALLGLAIICIAILLRYSDRRVAFANSASYSAGDLVVLEPENWVGQRLPIADSLDIDLSAGNWTVLLHRHDCPVCREQVPRYEMRATAGEQIAIVEVPPYGEIPDHKTQGLHGRLKSDRDWFVQTPVEILLHDGVVTATKLYSH